MLNKSAVQQHRGIAVVLQGYPASAAIRVFWKKQAVIFIKSLNGRQLRLAP
jgi:hypothetical protein